MATATVSYRAEIKDLRAQLAKITDVTRAEARKMVSDLDKSMRAVERSNKRAVGAIKGTANASKDLARASQSVAMQLPDVASQLAAGTPPAQVFTQQGLQVVQVNMDLLSKSAGKMGLSLASLGPIMLAVLPVVAAFGAAYMVMASQLEEAEARTAEVARTTKALGKAHNAMARQVADTDLELQKVTGTLDAVAAAQAKREKGIRRAAEAERRAAQALVDSAKARRAAAETIEEIQAAEAGLAQARRNRDRVLAGVNRKERTALTQAGQIAEVQRARAESEDFLREREERRARATAAAAKADAEALRLVREREAASERLAQIGASASLAVLTGEARVTEEYRRQIEQIAELERVSGDRINADAARAAVQQKHEQRIAALREKTALAGAARDKRLAQEVEAARREAMAQSLDVASQVAGGISEGLSRTYGTMMDEAVRLQDFQVDAARHLTKTQRKQLDRRVSDQKQAARNAFHAGQAAAAAEAAVQTALAVSKALGSAPPPFNFVLAGTALAAGVAQEAAIARQQPSFHRGGPVDLAPDEVAATVRRSEFVLNPTGRGMVGDGDLTRANAGQSPRGGEVVAVSVYKHTRQVDRWKRDGLNAGDPIARAIGRGKLVGHRSNR